MTVNPPNDLNDVTYTMTTLDNLGETTETQKFLYTGTNLTGDIHQGQSVPAPLNGSNDILLAQSTGAYDSLGQVYESAAYSVPGPEALESITFNGTTATATATTCQAFKVGDVVQISGATDPQYNQQFTVSGIRDNTFQYTMSGTAGSASGTLIATRVQPPKYLPSDTWYDADGNVLATRTGAGPIQKSVYNGAGELIGSYTCAVSTATASLSYGAATAVQTSDPVVQQEQTWYDADGNAVVTADYQTFPGSTATGALTAANSFVTVNANWYDPAGRQTASVNYGRQDQLYGNPDIWQNATLSRSANVATATVNNAFSTNDVVSITGATDLAFNGIHPIASATSPSFTYSDTGTSPSSCPGVVSLVSQKASGITWSSTGGGTATVTLPKAQSLYKNGEWVLITGASPTVFNGWFQITVTGTNPNYFTYSLPASSRDIGVGLEISIIRIVHDPTACQKLIFQARPRCPAMSRRLR